VQKQGVVATCASASADGTVKLWDVTTAMMDRAPSSKDRSPMNGNATTASASASSRPLSAIHTLAGHSRGINDVAWSHNAQYLATASDDKTLRLWDASTGDALVEFRGHGNFVFCAAFSPTSNLLASGSFDETVKLWDIRSGDCVSTLPAHSDPVTGVDFNWDGTCIVSGSHDGLMRIWDTATGECLKTVYAQGNPPVSSVQYSPNGKFVLSGTLDSRLRLWHVASPPSTAGIPQSSLPNHHDAPQSQQTQQTRGGKCTKTYTGHANSKFCCFSAFLVSNPQRHCIVSGSEDRKMYIYDLQTRDLLQTCEGVHTDAVLAVAAHDKRELLASGGMTLDKTVRFWAPASTSTPSSSLPSISSSGQPTTITSSYPPHKQPKTTHSSDDTTKPFSSPSAY
jgi:COMPASS component SWD3